MAQPSSDRRPKRLRMAGIIILLAGVIAAGVVYWLGTRWPDVSNDISMQGFNRSRDLQMSRLYGKSGLMMGDFLDWLQHPGAQALLIVTISGILAGGFFYFAYLLDEDDSSSTHHS